MLIACAAGVVLLVGGGAASGCTAPSPSGAVSLSTRVGGRSPVGRVDAEQTRHPGTIAAVGAQMDVPNHGGTVAVATAIPQAQLRNPVSGGDDSVGPLLQHPSQGRGSPTQPQDPAYTAATSDAQLLTVDGRQRMSPTRAGQAAQRSAHADATATRQADATTDVHAPTGASGGLGGCAVTLSAQGWTQPLRGPVGSGFRTAARPGHDGVDISAPKGSPIHAAAAGVVTRVRCNAVDVDTGAEYGCDRDGDPVRTRAAAGTSTSAMPAT
jgi:hypothetical protein